MDIVPNHYEHSIVASMTHTAAIVGGGIGGLAAAIHLLNNGWGVEVYERSAGLPTSGTALGMWPSALQALDTLGVGAAVRTLGRRQTHGAFLRPDGSRIAAIDVAAIQRRTGDPVYLLSRPALLRLLAGALDDTVVRFDTDVPDIRALDGYDVVIAADGVNSRARAVLFGDTYQARYAGTTAWRGTADGDVGTVTETWGEGARFGITPQEAGRTNWFACVIAPEGQRAPGGEVAALHTHFGHWHSDVRKVLSNLNEKSVLRHDLYHLDPPLPSFVKGRIALIGDAAHAMTPDLGRGACEALIDATTLAGSLIENSRVDNALASYDATRRKTTQRLARTSRLMNRMVHTRRLVMLRNTAMKLALAVGNPPN